MLAAVLAAFGGPIASLFNADAEVVAAARLYFWIVPISYGLNGVLRISAGTLTVLSRPLLVSLVSVLQTFALHLPLAFIGADLLGIARLFGSEAISFLVGGSVAFLVLKLTMRGAIEFDQIAGLAKAEAGPTPLGYWVARLQSLGSRYLDETLLPYGLDRNTLPFFGAISRHGPIGRAELADRLEVERRAAASAAERLVDLGYVGVAEGEAGGKLATTERGKEVAPEVRGLLGAWTEVLTRGMSDEEREMVRSLLQRMYDNARASSQEAAAESG